MRKITYTVVVENAGENFSAYAPDLPGCVSTGRTADEAIERMREAIPFHIEGLLEDGKPLPAPSARSTDVTAEVPG
jgi:predicted RNase H-like HicB family nuclease